MPLPPRFNFGHSLLLAAFGTAIALVFFAACGNAKNPQPESRPITISDSKAIIPSVPTGPAGVAKNADGTHGKDRVDLEKLNGKIFEDWANPNPRAVLIITGSQDGYVEPCGCAGLENQKGGMSRRHSMFKSLAKRGWIYGAIDTGGLIKGFGEQTKLKYDTAMNSLKAMKYGAVGIGGPELSLGRDFLTSYTADEDYNVMSANVSTDKKADEDLVYNHFKIITINGVKIGVVSIVGKSEYSKFKDNFLHYRTPSEGIKLVLPKLLDAKCNRLILLTYATKKESFELVEEFPEFNDVVITDCGDEPPTVPEVREFTKNGKTYKTEIIETGKKGMCAVAIGFFDSQDSPVRYQRIPLDARFEDSPEITKIFTKYQEDMQMLGLAGLGIKTGANAPAHPTGRTTYAGSETCGDCHSKAYKIWKESPHFHATDTLVKLTPPRQFDPECISCHVTGWDPQHYYPYKGGYTGMKETAHLMQNGCENCHGPGGNHVDIEMGHNKATVEEQKKVRLEMRVAKEQSLCTKCHDTDNDPKFDFKAYWPKIEHKGKD